MNIITQFLQQSKFKPSPAKQLSLPLLLIGHRQQTMSITPTKFTVHHALFLLSHMLYQSYFLFILEPVSPQHSTPTIILHWQLSSLICTVILVMLVLACVYGWVEYLYYKNGSAVLEYCEMFGMPTAVAVFAAYGMPADVGVEFALSKLLPLALLCISTGVKIALCIQLPFPPSKNSNSTPCLLSYSALPALILLFRLILYPVFCLFVSPQIKLYFMLVMQACTSLYRYHYFTYFMPEIEFMTMIAELWGWTCILAQLIWPLNQTEVMLICVFGVLCYWARCPTAGMVGLIERKVMRSLERMKKNRDPGYNVFIVIYFWSTNSSSITNFMHELWNHRFKLSIQLKFFERDYKVSQHFKTTHTLKSKHQIAHARFSQVKGITQQAEKINTPHPNQDQDLKQFHHHQLLRHILDKSVLSCSNRAGASGQRSFVSCYFLCFLVSQVYPSLPVTMFEMYYRLLQIKQQKDHTIFTAAQMNNMYNFILSSIALNSVRRTTNEKIDEDSISGTIQILPKTNKSTIQTSIADHKSAYIRNILQHEQFNNLLYKYIQNQSKFPTLLTLSSSSASSLYKFSFQSYLATKMSLKAQLSTHHKLLMFNFPMSTSLITNQYLLERYVDNNEITSKNNLQRNVTELWNRNNKRFNLNVAPAGHKNAGVSLAEFGNTVDNCVVLCRWSISGNQYNYNSNVSISGNQQINVDADPTNNEPHHDQNMRQKSVHSSYGSNIDIGDIVHWNQKFHKIWELNNYIKVHGHTFKISSLIPEPWRKKHDEAMSRMGSLQHNYAHDKNAVYYMEIPTNTSSRLIQCKNLRTVPYFQQSSTLMFLITFQVDESSLNQDNDIYIEQYTQRAFPHLKGSKKDNQLPTTKLLTTNNDLRSKHRIAFRHEVFEDENNFKVDVSYKIVEVFGHKYVVEHHCSQVGIYTRSMIQGDSQDKVAQDIRAVIDLGAHDSNAKVEVFERNKGKVDLLADMKMPLIMKTVILSVCLLTGVSIVSSQFSTSTTLVSKVAQLQLYSHSISMNVVSYQMAVLTFVCNFNSLYYPAKTPAMNALLSNYIDLATDLHRDLLALGSHFNGYIDFIHHLASIESIASALLDPINSTDFISCLNCTSENQNAGSNTISEHVEHFNTIIDSAIQLIENEMFQHWIVALLRSNLREINDLSENNAYVEDLVIGRVKGQVRARLELFRLIFWVIFAFGILALIAFGWVLVRGKVHIQRILFKPLQISKQQLRKFKQNYRQLQSKIQMPTTSSPVAPSSNFSMSSTLNQQSLNYLDEQNTCRQLISRSSLLQTGYDRMTKSQIKETENESRLSVSPGQFYNHTALSLLLVLLVSLLMAVCLCMLLVVQTGNGGIIGKLDHAQEFSVYHEHMFALFNRMLEYINNMGTLSPSQRAREQLLIEQMRRKLNEISIVDVVNNMMIDEKIARVVLFQDPCSYIAGICQSSKIWPNGPYLAHVQQYFSNLHKLHASLNGSASSNPNPNPNQSQSQTQSQSINNITLKYILDLATTVHWLSNINIHITTANIQAISARMQSNQIYLILCNCLIILFILAVAGELYRVVHSAKQYGRQILAMLPSGTLCQDINRISRSRRGLNGNMLEYEVNCVYYRTGFAKNTTQI